MNRRHLLTAAAAFALIPRHLRADPPFEITRTPAQWRALLTDAEYAVLREAATERAGSSPLDKRFDPGIYHRRGCDLALYPSSAKFDSGTGWPSFRDSLRGSVGTKEDDGFFARLTEVHCRRCGGHLGHIFDDGPAPTGQRHCLNGIARVFRAA